MVCILFGNQWYNVLASPLAVLVVEGTGSILHYSLPLQ